MTGEIAFVIFTIVKAPSVCLDPYNVFVDASAPTIHV
jgi:hypothetical protein